MKNLKLILSLSMVSAVFAGLAAQAAPVPVTLLKESSVATVVENKSVADGGCKYDMNDPEENGYRITEFSQSQKGKCVDTNTFRFGRVTDFVPGKKIVVTNFRHQNKFWTAEIPLGKNDWTDAYLHIVRFRVVEGVEAAHSQTRFKASYTGPGVKLTLQTDPKVKATVRDFVLTIEAAFPKGVTYNFADGAFDNYPLVGRLESGIQRVIEDPINEAEQYELIYDRKNPVRNLEILVKHVENAVRRSESIGLSKFYNTVRPNCVTEAFDIIDETRGVRWCDEKLASDMTANQKGLCVRPFYTAMWLDPVAKPALNALNARGILGKQIMNLKQEYTPFIGAPKPVAKEGTPSLIRSNPKKPFTLVVLAEKSDNSDATTKKVQLEVQKTLSAVIPTLSSVGIAPALATASSSGAIGGIVKFVQAQLKDMVLRMNKDLPEKPVYMVAYFAPWETGKSKPLSLASAGFPADLPFNYSPYLEVSKEISKSVMGEAYSNMLELQAQQDGKFPVYSLEQISAAQKKGQALSNPSPVFMMGAVIRLKLERSRSESTVQVVMSMVPQDLPFSTADKVDLTRIRIPKVESGRRSSMVISHIQKLPFNDTNPIINVMFGGLSPISTDTLLDFNRANWGLVNIYRGEKQVQPFMCDASRNLIPEMQGTFYPGLLKADQMKVTTGDGKLVQSAVKGIEGVLDKQPVSIGIYALKLVMAEEYCNEDIRGRSDKKKIEFCEAYHYGNNTSGIMVWDMQVSFRSAGQCLIIPQIGKIVNGEANATIGYKIGDAQKKAEKSLMNVLMGSNGENAKLAARVMMEANVQKAKLDAAAKANALAK